MEENLKIIQEILILTIKLDQSQNLAIEAEYHSASSKLTISVCSDRNTTFNDGLTRKWWVSVKNKELLETVLKELKSLENPIEDDDFLGN
ncbi:hypothetical protein [Clostridium beijerinckii]|uniref:Uncharacterized protein n=1 Tax=Clostridium beijerinckii TaxID=1520 RepID=A0AAX0AYZ6_CLOBE|nr:hypothetical protein [Clostridium beijerinckii]NRT88132.1 hypothetical protein [Clostridium beijerinckii]NYC73560.1 hypothetical protein [Clostridium beijerinckii]